MEQAQDKELQIKVATYQPSPDAMETIRQVPLLLAVGISGAGKDTVLRRLIAEYPEDYRFLVTHTTRQPRMNNGVMEQDGIKYHFVSKSESNRMLDAQEYLETNYYASNVYGTSIVEVASGNRDHKILVSDIDVNGVANYVRLGMNAKPVFILPPNYTVWRERWQQRYGDDDIDQADLRRRFQTALQELQAALDHDYYYIIVNDDLEKTVHLINDIAHGEQVERHYPKAVDIAQQLAADIQAELDHTA
jgi:guanylate kinase